MTHPSGERPHHKYSPSKAERIKACPGSVRQCASVPARPPSVYSIEGTKAHVVLQAALENGVRWAREAHVDHSFLCMEELDVQFGGPYKSFYFSVQQALDYVYDILDKHPDAVLSIEQEVNPPSEAAPGEAGGWCDISIYIPSLRQIIVVDYKHGAGVTKAVYGNRQVLQYGAGLVYGPGPNGEPAIDPADIDIVTLCIVQPRAFHEDGDIREYDVTPWELQEYLWDMDEAIRAAQSPNAPLIPEDLTDPKGSRQCQFCDAAPTCPAREAKALAVVNTTFAAVRDIHASGIPDPTMMTVEQLEYAAMHIPTLRSWADKVDDRLFELAKQGYGLAHHKIVETQAIRKWYGAPSDVANQLAALAGVPRAKVIEEKLIGIGDAEKLMVEAFKRSAAKGKKRDAAADAKKAMAYLTLKQGTGNLTLVTNDDPRPPVDRATVAFNQISGILLPGTTVGDDE